MRVMTLSEQTETKTLQTPGLGDGNLHLVDIKIGYLPPWDNTRHIYWPIDKGEGSSKKLGKIQRAILELLQQRPYRVNGLDLALKKSFGTTWNALLGLNRRGLLAHVLLTDVNAFGCPLDYRYYALAKQAGDGSLASRLELAIRCLEVAEGDRIAGQRRSLDMFTAMAELAATLNPYTRKSITLRYKSIELERQFHSEHPELTLGEATPPKTMDGEG